MPGLGYAPMSMNQYSRAAFANAGDFSRTDAAGETNNLSNFFYLGNGAFEIATRDIFKRMAEDGFPTDVISEDVISSVGSDGMKYFIQGIEDVYPPQSIRVLTLKDEADVVHGMSAMTNPPVWARPVQGLVNHAGELVGTRYNARYVSIDAAASSTSAVRFDQIMEYIAEKYAL